MKVLLILSDGMRPDSIEGHPVIKQLKEKSTYCMDAKTIMPCLTLPCHISLFHSTDASRHGIITNTFVPQAKPIPGLFEQLHQNGKKCAMFYNWEELRDISRPGSLSHSEYYSEETYGAANSNQLLCERVTYILRNEPFDFTFLYLGWVDDAGHQYGWMSDEYRHAVNETCNMIGDVIACLEKDYTIILTADHGGHDRMHGIDIPEDMTIPIFFYGNTFEKGKVIQNISIKDIAPTITNLLGVKKSHEWEGTIVS